MNGLLNPKQSERFVTMLTAVPNLTCKERVVSMNGLPLWVNQLEVLLKKRQAAIWRTWRRGVWANPSGAPWLEEYRGSQVHQHRCIEINRIQRKIDRLAWCYDI